jgi:hypothetical protein
MLERIWSWLCGGCFASCAIVWINKLEDLIGEFKAGFDDQCKRLSDVDLELSEILYESEDVRFNEVEGHRYAKRIQELRAKRRQIKIEFEMYQRVNSQLLVSPNFKLERIKKVLLSKEKELNKNPEM